jgi:hypothetical protein
MNALGLDEQHALLKIVVDRLERCNIPYMVAGSVAANSYMTPRATNDIDLVIKINEDDIDKLIAAFEEDFYINSREAIQDSLQRRYPFNAIYLATAAKVDLVPLKSELFEQTEFNRRHPVMIRDEKAWFVTPEDYIISKLRTYVTTKSDFQLTDLRNVLGMQMNQLDWNYVWAWAERFRLRSELETIIDDIRRRHTA